MGKKETEPAKIRMPLKDAVEFARLITMPGTLTTEDESKRKRADLFPEFEGVVKGDKIRVIASNMTGNVFMQLTYKCEVLTPGEVWCGHNGKFGEYIGALKTDGDVIIEFDKMIELKTTDVNVKMRNLSKDMMKYPLPARSINEKFIVNKDPWIYNGPNGEVSLDAKFRIGVSDLKPIVHDGSLMDQVYYPFYLTKVDGRMTIIVQAKTEYDSIERRIVPIESNGGEFNTDYQVGIDSVLLNTSGELTIRAGHKSPMAIVSETDKYKLVIFLAPRIPDTEAVITDEMFLEDGESIDLAPTTVSEEEVNDGGEEDDFI